MENKFTYKDVPYGFWHCLETDCPMANHCLHQLAMQSVTKEIHSVLIINPQLTKPSEQCEFYRCDKPEVYARGFTNMQKYMLPGQYDTFRYRLIGKFGRTGYFERRKGDRLCTPNDIRKVEAVLKDLGLEHLKFDAYEEHINWND